LKHCAAVTDETLLTSAFPLPREANFYAPGHEEGSIPPQVWTGLGDEFRNRIARLTAGTVQLREGLPRATVSDFAPALADMESSLDSLTALVRCVDAVMVPGGQVISDLGDVIERAVVLARPWIRREARIVVGSRVGAVRNRSGAVELALATIMVALLREPHPGPVGFVPELRIEARSGRGLLVVELDSNGTRPTPGWRWSLAERLAATVSGTLEILPDRAGVELRFQ
jgi:hypothetical protein